jgi:hypothetical protein
MCWIVLEAPVPSVEPRRLIAALMARAFSVAAAIAGITVVFAVDTSRCMMGISRSGLSNVQKRTRQFG